jgi:hypothetical protein
MLIRLSFDYQLINTLSSSLLNPPTSQNITASKAWSLRSLQLADRALEEEASETKGSGAVKSICERARIVAEFNMGALLEVSSWLLDYTKAYIAIIIDPIQSSCRWKKTRQARSSTSNRG